jgi:hypothetical protein
MKYTRSSLENKIKVKYEDVSKCKIRGGKKGAWVAGVWYYQHG